MPALPAHQLSVTQMGPSQRRDALALMLITVSGAPAVLLVAPGFWLEWDDGDLSGGVMPILKYDAPKGQAPDNFFLKNILLALCDILLWSRCGR
jgi:hypothetical protein